MEEVFTKVEPDYPIITGEHYIVVERKGKQAFYVKKEGKINWHHTDFNNFLWYNLGRIEAGSTVTMFRYVSPLDKRVQKKIKVI